MRVFKLLTVAAFAAALPAYGLQFTAGSSPLSTSEYALTSSGTIDEKTHTTPTFEATLTGLGVRGGRTNGEIDENEWILVTFTKPQLISEFSVAYLYNGREYGDPLEHALVTINGLGETGVTYDLFHTVVDNGEELPTWTGTGTVEMLSKPVSQTGTTPYGNAWYRVNNPFGDTPVSSIKFWTREVWPDKTGQDSDYALVSFGTRVPDGGTTLMLLGAGCLALGWVRRRRS